MKQQALLYLRETLGIQYISRNLSSAKMNKETHTLKHPEFVPSLIFVNFDPADTEVDPSRQETFEKIVKAMKLSASQVWWAEASHMSLVDFLTIIRRWHFEQVPLVILKSEPDIKSEIQLTGPHSWIECYSLDRMMKKAELKKITWKLLQLLIPNGDKA